MTAATTITGGSGLVAVTTADAALLGTGFVGGAVGVTVGCHTVDVNVKIAELVGTRVEVTTTDLADAETTESSRIDSVTSNECILNLVVIAVPFFRRGLGRIFFPLGGIGIRVIQHPFFDQRVEGGSEREKANERSQKGKGKERKKKQRDEI